MKQIINAISRIYRLLIFLFLPLYGTSQANMGSLNFICKIGSRTMPFSSVCDGISDSENGSDEKVCETEAILFYFNAKRAMINDNRNYNNYRIQDLSLFVVNLHSNEEFSALITHQKEMYYGLSFQSDFQLNPNWPRIDFSYKDQSQRVSKRMAGNGSISDVNWNPKGIQNTVVDWITTNVYAIYNSRVQVCDKDILACITLKSKFFKNPSFLLAISPKHRILFCITQTSPYLFYLIKYHLYKSSETKQLLQRHSRSPIWLTIDAAKDRIYWMDISDSGVLFWSTTFEGTDLEETIPGRQIPKQTPIFAVFDNTIYWPENESNRGAIWKCLATSCHEPVIFKQSSGYIDPSRDLESKFYHLIIDEYSLGRNPCNHSWCSHLCLPESDDAFRCYCDGSDSDKPVPNNLGNGYCVDNTLIATHGNHVYVIGLTSDRTLPSIFHKNNINISAISTVTYNSVEGSVILTEMGRQNIYSWMPRTSALKLIISDGLGTIDSIEFDDFTNNLYWVDPERFEIKVLNLATQRRAKILKGDPTYLPKKLTLAPGEGYIFVLFLQKNSSIVIERIQMRVMSREVLHEYRETDDVHSLSLYYMRESKRLCLLDLQRNEIKYFVGKTLGFQHFVTDNIESTMESFTMLNHSVIWSEDDVIHIGNFNESTHTISLENQILLGVKSHENTSSILRIAAVGRKVWSSCLRDNGDCGRNEICIGSDENANPICLYVQYEEFVINRSYWGDVIAIDKEDVSSEKSQRDIIDGHHKSGGGWVSTTVETSIAPSSRTTQLATSITKAAQVEHYSHQNSPHAQDAQSANNSVLFWLFIIITIISALLIVMRFLSECSFRMSVKEIDDTTRKDFNLIDRFRHKRGNYELSQIQGESTIALYSEDVELTNEE